MLMIESGRALCSMLTPRRFGYDMRFVDRQQIIRGLWDNLRDKSKILISRQVVKIVCGADQVAVTTDDGSVFHGDIVVGADGVHSKVKQEMQRIAAAEAPGRDLFPEKDCEILMSLNDSLWIGADVWHSQASSAHFVVYLVFPKHRRVFFKIKRSRLSERAAVTYVSAVLITLCIGFLCSRMRRRPKADPCLDTPIKTAKNLLRYAKMTLFDQG
jgi:2-polyprenyl-6-methoxyphenol hydroxylase-like FAD-dependent oxidoreductase